MSDEFVTLTSDDTPTPPAPPPPAMTTTPKVLYVVDSSRATFGELWRDTHSPVALISKLLRIRMPGSVNDPNVETLAPFEIAESALPSDVREVMEPGMWQMHALGFDLVAVHEIHDLFNQSRTDVATFSRADGGAVGRVWRRTEVGSRTHAYVDFVTGFADGTFVWSTAARSVLQAPPQVQVTRQSAAAPETLWQIHQAAVQRRAVTSGAPAVPAAGREQVLALVERHHALVRDFHLARKLFRPMRDADRQHATELETHVGDATAAGMANPEVWAELVRMQQRKSGIGSALLLLVVSLMLFVGIGAARWEWEFVVMVVGLLAFHELGHFAAMKIFRYRNVRMFFIPLLGAAVSGVNYSAPGWKKVVVALAGPLPGIALGAVAGVAGIYLKNEMLLKVGVLALILNGFNLLPVLPLDGGRVVHTLFFARHWVLDVIFRLAACLALIAGSWAIGDRILLFLGVFMLIGIPGAYKMARVAADLRREGIRPALPDEKMIPPDVADRIIAKVRQAFPVAMSSRTTAQHTLNVYETVNTRTPGWVATIAFTIVHVGAVLFVIVAGVAFAIAQRGGVESVLTETGQLRVTPPPKHELIVADVRPAERPPAPTTAPASVIATFEATGDAQSRYEALRGRTPVTLFGRSVILPVADADARQLWFEELRKHTRNTLVVASRSENHLALDCAARDAATAQIIVAEAEEYLNLPVDFHLIPPWSPQYDPAHRDEWRRARRTYLKLHNFSHELAGNPELTAATKRIAELQPGGDTTALEKAIDERAKLYQRLRHEYRRRLADGADAAIDPAIAQTFLRHMEEYEQANLAQPEPQQAAQRYQRLIETLARELAPRMGQIELTDGRPVNASNRYGSDGGHASNAAAMVRFRWLDLVDPADGAPALARWLAAQGCGDFRYEFKLGGRYFFGSDDDDEAAAD